MRMNMLAGRVKIPGFMTLCLTFSENELILGYNRLWGRYGKRLLRYLSCRGDHQRARAREDAALLKGEFVYWKKALFVISVTHMHSVPLSIVNENLSLFSKISKFTSSTVKLAILMRRKGLSRGSEICTTSSIFSKLMITSAFTLIKCPDVH